MGRLSWRGGAGDHWGCSLAGPPCSETECLMVPPCIEMLPAPGVLARGQGPPGMLQGQRLQTLCQGRPDTSLSARPCSGWSADVRPAKGLGSAGQFRGCWDGEGQAGLTVLEGAGRARLPRLAKAGPGRHPQVLGSSSTRPRGKTPQPKAGRGGGPEGLRAQLGVLGLDSMSRAGEGGRAGSP